MPLWNLGIPVMLMMHESLSMEKMWMEAESLWNLRRGFPEDLVVLEILAEVLLLVQDVVSIVELKAIGLEIAKLETGRINAIAVVSVVTLRKTVTTAPKS